MNRDWCYRSLLEIVSPQLGKYCPRLSVSGNISPISAKQFPIVTSTPVSICILIRALNKAPSQSYGLSLVKLKLNNMKLSCCLTTQTTKLCGMCITTKISSIQQPPESHKASKVLTACRQVIPTLYYSMTEKKIFTIFVGLLGGLDAFLSLMLPKSRLFRLDREVDRQIHSYT